MDQSRIFEHRKTFQQLLGENLDELCAQALELVLLDELVEVRRKAFEDEAQVAFVHERFEHTKDVMCVTRIVLLVQLGGVSHCRCIHDQTYQVQDGHLHFALIQVCRLVLYNLDSADIVCPHILTLYNLTESALTEDIEDQVSMQNQPKSWIKRRVNSPVTSVLSS